MVAYSSVDWAECRFQYSSTWLLSTVIFEVPSLSSLFCNKSISALVRSTTDAAGSRVSFW